MIKKISSRCKVAAIFSMAIIVLTACGPAVEENSTTKVTETTTQEFTTAIQEQPTGYDINGKLEATKQEVAEYLTPAHANTILNGRGDSDESGAKIIRLKLSNIYRIGRNGSSVM